MRNLIAIFVLTSASCAVDVPEPHDGFFACETNKDCAQDEDWECINDQCVKMGSDTCTPDSCTFPMGCLEGYCQMQPDACGPGNFAGFCPGGFDCFQWQAGQGVCATPNAGQCNLFDGPGSCGVDECLPKFECNLDPTKDCNPEQPICMGSGFCTAIGECR